MDQHRPALCVNWPLWETGSRGCCTDLDVGGDSTRSAMKMMMTLEGQSAPHCWLFRRPSVGNSGLILGLVAGVCAFHRRFATWTGAIRKASIPSMGVPPMQSRDECANPCLTDVIRNSAARKPPDYPGRIGVAPRSTSTKPPAQDGLDCSSDPVLSWPRAESVILCFA